MNGRLYDRYNEILSAYDFYNDYMSGKTDRKKYAEELLARRNEISGKGIAGWNFDRMLLHSNGERDVSAMLAEFCARGGYDADKLEEVFTFDAYKKYAGTITPEYLNGEYVTAIFPEDEMLMYAASKMAKASTMFIAGGYFGYWVIWAMEEIKKNGGMCTLADINPDVTAVSKQNMEKFGFSQNAFCAADDAEKLLLSSDEPIDLLALDATGNGADPRPQYRGKRIYAVMLRAALKRLYSGSFIIVHNLERKDDMKELTDILDDISVAYTEMPTYNGLGLYRVR